MLNSTKLKDTPLGTPEEFNVVVEIPRGSADKIEYDEVNDEMVAGFTFKDGFTFGYNYGFIPQTYPGGGSDDALDVILLGQTPIPSGTVMLCRPVAIMYQIDRGEVDNKIIAAAVNNSETEKYQTLKDIPQKEIQDFILFYAEIARQRKKTIEINGFGDKDQAIEEIKKAMI